MMGYLLLLFLFFVLLFNVVPKYPYLYILRGTKLIGKGDMEKGLALFEKGARSGKVNAFNKVRYAFLELKFGNREKAKQMLSLVINDKKTDRATRYDAKAVYALTSFLEGNPQDAKEIMAEVYENHKNTNIYCTLGYLYNLLEEPQKALAFNREAADYNREHPVISDNLGQAAYLCENYEEAAKIYASLLEKKPDFPEAYYNYGLVLQKLGRQSEAVEQFKEALKKPFNNLTTVTKEEIERSIKHANL